MRGSARDQVGEREPLHNTFVDVLHGTAVNGNDGGRIDRKNDSARSGDDVVQLHAESLLESIGEKAAEREEAKSLLADATSAAATTAPDLTAAETSVHQTTHAPDKPQTFQRQVLVATSSADNGMSPSSAIKSPGEDPEEPQTDSRKRRGRKTKQGRNRQQLSIAVSYVHREYAVSEQQQREEEATVREEAKAVWCSTAAARSNRHVGSNGCNDEGSFTTDGAAVNTATSCKSKSPRLPFQHAGVRSFAAEQEEEARNQNHSYLQHQQSSSRSLARHSAPLYSSAEGTWLTPQLMTEKSPQLPTTSCVTQQQSKEKEDCSMQQSDSSYALVPLHLHSAAQKTKTLVDVATEAGCVCRASEADVHAQQDASFLLEKQEQNSNNVCSREENIEQQNDTFSVEQHNEEGSDVTGRSRPLLSPAQSGLEVSVIQKNPCSTSRGEMRASAGRVAGEPSTETVGRLSYASAQNTCGRCTSVCLDSASPSSVSAPVVGETYLSLPPTLSASLVAEARQMTVSTVELAHTSARQQSNNSTSSRNRGWSSWWRFLPVCGCCWLRAWAGRERRVSSLPISSDTGDATAVSGGERVPPNLCSGSYNVYLLLVISAFTTLFNVTAQGQLFDNWLFFLGNGSTIWVGKAESISGMTSLVSAVPVGFAVDRVDRSKLCKVGAVLGVVSSLISCLGCWWSSVRVVVVSLVLLGVTWELFTSAGSAIFTDTLDDFSRVYWFTVQGVVMTFCAAVGPGLMAIYFLIYGDKWEMPIMQRAIISSTLIFGVGGSLLFCGVRNPPRRTRRFSGVPVEEVTAATSAAHVPVGPAGGGGTLVVPDPTTSDAFDAANREVAERRHEDTPKNQVQLLEGRPHDEGGVGKVSDVVPDVSKSEKDVRQQEQEQQQQKHLQTCMGISSPSSARRRYCHSSRSTAFCSTGSSTQAPYSSLVSTDERGGDGHSGEEEDYILATSSSLGRKRKSIQCSNGNTSSNLCSEENVVARPRNRKSYYVPDGPDATSCSTPSNGRNRSSARGVSSATAGHAFKDELLLPGVREETNTDKNAKEKGGGAAFLRVFRDKSPSTPSSAIVAAAAGVWSASADVKSVPSASCYYSALPPSDCGTPCADCDIEKGPASIIAAGLARFPAGEETRRASQASSVDYYCTCRAPELPIAGAGLLCPIHSTREVTPRAASRVCTHGDLVAGTKRVSDSSVPPSSPNCGWSSPVSSALSSSSSSDVPYRGVHASEKTTAAAAAISCAPLAPLAYPRGDNGGERKSCLSQQVTSQSCMRGSFAASGAASPLLAGTHDDGASPSATPRASNQTFMLPERDASPSSEQQYHQDPAAVSRRVAASSFLSAASSQTVPNEEWMNSLTSAQRKIPYLVAVSDAVRALGGGMTVKFFPIFFEETYRFTPLQICNLASALYISVGLFMIVGVPVYQKVVDVFAVYAAPWMSVLSNIFAGRAGAVCALTFAGLCMLMSICVVQKVEVMVVLYILRGALQNAATPLSRSIVMDFTSTRNRGKWNAVQSFNSTLWSGSAFLGGFVADINMRVAFFVTGALYLVAWAIFIPVLCLLPEAEKKFR